jgi:hypothetical protein
VIQEFKNIHEGQNVLCLGTGRSILNTPVEFLKSMPSIGINFLPYYKDLLDGFMPTYWTALDTPPLMVMDVMPAEIVRFLPSNHRIRADQAGHDISNVVVFDIRNMPKPLKGEYTTTMSAAIQIALYMGAKNVLIDGFDCTTGYRNNVGTQPGVTGTAHFYDREGGVKYAKHWDLNIGIWSSWSEPRGQHIWNISDPTRSVYVRKSSYTNWQSSPIQGKE